MASALETRIRKLESQVAVIAERSKGHVNKPPFDWEGYIRIWREMEEAHLEWWRGFEEWSKFNVDDETDKTVGGHDDQEIRAADNKN
jgi:hypothetical protein